MGPVQPVARGDDPSTSLFGTTKPIRELTVPSDLSFAFSIYRRPDLAYLRSKDRSQKWDRDTFIALAAGPTDPKLGETAWHRALAEGSPRNRLCLASGAELALAQRRPEAALDFWYEAEHHGGSDSSIRCWGTG